MQKINKTPKTSQNIIEFPKTSYNTKSHTATTKTEKREKVRACGPKKFFRRWSRPPGVRGAAPCPQAYPYIFQPGRLPRCEKRSTPAPATPATCYLLPGAPFLAPLFHHQKRKRKKITSVNRYPLTGQPLTAGAAAHLRPLSMLPP